MRVSYLLVLLLLASCASPSEPAEKEVVGSFEDAQQLLEEAVSSGDRELLSLVVGAPSEQGVRSEALVGFFAGLDSLRVLPSEQPGVFDGLVRQSPTGVTRVINETSEGVRYLHTLSGAEEVVLYELPVLEAGGLRGSAHLPFVLEEGRWYLSSRMGSVTLADTSDFLVSVRVNESAAQVGVRDLQGRFLFLPGSSHELVFSDDGVVVCAGEAVLEEVEDVLPSGDVHVSLWHSLPCSFESLFVAKDFSLSSNESAVSGRFFFAAN